MIAAATQQYASGRLFFNWFDVALVAVLVFGLWRGRRNGMSKELLPLTQMLVLVIAATFCYQPLGDLLIQKRIISGIFGHGFNEKTAGYVTSYLLVVAVVCLVFSFIKRPLKPKMEGSNFFGSGEYYLGMVSGFVRYGCILILPLALLNAPVYSQADIAASKAFSNRWFGGGLEGYSGDFFPTLSEVQTSVFKESLTGPFLKDDLPLLLVNTGGPVRKPVMSINQ